MGRKSKFSPEIKLECVQQYISGVGSGELCKQYGILDSKTITKWVGIYRRDGAAGLITPSVNKRYSSELKQKVIAEYRSGQASLSQLCLKYHISAVSVIRRWLKGDTISPCKGGTKTPNRKKNSAKSFTKEQKIEAVKQCLENDKNYQETAHRFGCTYTQIYNWVPASSKIVPPEAFALWNQKGCSCIAGVIVGFAGTSLRGWSAVHSSQEERGAPPVIPLALKDFTEPRTCQGTLRSSPCQNLEPVRPPHCERYDRRRAIRPL